METGRTDVGVNMMGMLHLTNLFLPGMLALERVILLILARSQAAYPTRVSQFTLPAKHLWMPSQRHCIANCAVPASKPV